MVLLWLWWWLLLISMACFPGSGESDPSLPRLALGALRSVLEYRPSLGLSVLTECPQGKVRATDR